jgi:hypothetical protein
MKQEQRHADARFTTMVDLYRIPADFPGVQGCKRIADPLKKVEYLESQFEKEVNDRRLIPYIQLHEFESLLFSDPDAFLSAFPQSDAEIEELRRIRNVFPSPEHIDDGNETAPSKRICNVWPGYAKTSYGVTVAKAIGLSKMRAECTHFNRWVETLSQLSTR